MKTTAPTALSPVLQQAVTRHPVWTHAEEVEAGRRLVAARRSGRAAAIAKAEKEFTERNLLLVVAIARRYVGRGRLAFDDLVAEGLSGLLHAVRKFDPARRVRFNTYAVTWVHQRIGRAQAESDEIYLPLKVVETRRLLAYKAVEYETDRGRPPTIEELAAYACMPRKVVARALSAPAATTSLDARLGEGRDTIADATPANAPSPFDVVDQEERRQHVREAVGRLPERARFVVERRFGFDDDDDKTLLELGAPLGVTRERVRQIELQALSQLRSDAILRRLQRAESR